MNTLQLETQRYWLISSIWYGRIDKSLTMKQGLNGIKEILKATGPKRKLSSTAAVLMAELISPKKATQKQNFEPIPIRKTGA